MFAEARDIAKRIKDPVVLEETIILIAGKNRPGDHHIIPKREVCQELLGLLEEAQLEALFNRMNDHQRLQSWILGRCTSVDFVVKKLREGNVSGECLKPEMLRACIAQLLDERDCDIRKTLERRLPLHEATRD